MGSAVLVLAWSLAVLATLAPPGPLDQAEHASRAALSFAPWVALAGLPRSRAVGAARIALAASLAAAPVAAGAALDWRAPGTDPAQLGWTLAGGAALFALALAGSERASRRTPQRATHRSRALYGALWLGVVWGAPVLAAVLGDSAGSVEMLAAWSPLAWILDRAAGAANDGLALVQPVATSLVLLGLAQVDRQ